MGRWKSFKEFIIGREEKQSLTSPIIISNDGSGKIKPQVNYDNFARETYLKNSTAFASIDEISKCVASVPWSEYVHMNDNKTEKVTDTSISEMVERPNPNESYNFVMLKASAYLAMCGNSFLEKVKPDSGPNKNEPKELYAHRPDRFEFKTNPYTGQMEKYIYKIGGRETSWDVDPITGQADILHLKSFHPLDDFWGAAPTESASREIDTSNAAAEWNMNLLQNQGRPGMAYTLIGNLSEAEFDRMEQRLRQDKSGPSNVGKDIIITGENGTKVEPYGWSPTDMDFSEGDLRIMRKIAMAYRVPPMLLGIPGEATFANYKEARLAFWESTVLYYLNYIRGEMNNWLYEAGSKFFINYSLDEVPALSVKRDARWEKAQNSDFLSVDEKRELVGLDKYEPSEDPGSLIYIEASKIPLGIEVEEPQKVEEETIKMLQDEGYSENEIDEFLGYSYPEEKGKYNCECLVCGHQQTSNFHCNEIFCSECGGEMRRASRPGIGKSD